MSKPRFSKATLADYLVRKFFSVERVFKDETGKNFDFGNGWDQVKGENEAANRAYGEITAIRAIFQEFQLPIA